MLQDIVVYDATTKQTRIERIEVEDIIEEIPSIPKEPTLEERVAELERFTQEQYKLMQELTLLMKGE